MLLPRNEPPQRTALLAHVTLRFMTSISNTHPSDPAAPNQKLSFAARLGTTFIPLVTAGFIANRVTLPEIPGWYAQLVKPSFNPPNWLFGPAWGVLYMLMAVAVWRILRTEPGLPLRRAGLVLFFAQLALNCGWSIAFFGLHSPGLALFVIAPFWLLICATLAAFWVVDRLAGLCFVPYIIWVSFAFVLNGSIWLLNH